MRVALIAETEVFWNSLLGFTEKLHPTKTIDKANLPISPPAAIKQVLENLHLRLIFYEFVFLVDGISIVTVISLQDITKLTTDANRAIFRISLNNVENTLKQLCSKTSTTELRQVGNTIYNILKTRMPELLKDTVKKGLEDGTWTMS